MTRNQAVQKVIDHIAAQRPGERFLAEAAFDDPRSPMHGCLFMLEALGLVRLDDEPH